MWHIKWEQSKRKCELSFSYGKCFPYKSFFLTSPRRFLLECSIFKKWLLFHVSSPSVQTEAMGMTDKTGSGGQGSFERWEFGLILKEQSVSPSRPRMQKPFFVFTVTFSQTPTTVTSFSSWQIHTHIWFALFTKTPSRWLSYFIIYFHNRFIHESHHLHPPRKRRSCSPPLVGRWRWRCLCLLRRSGYLVSRPVQSPSWTWSSCRDAASV